MASERTEERFRKANERTKSQLVDLSWLDLQPFVCECADADCLTVVEATEAEYDGVRARQDAYLLAPGHDTRLRGDVVDRNDRYVVVVVT